MEIKFQNRLIEFKNALGNFETSLSIPIDQYPKDVQDSIKSGQIQKFEFCIELTWKVIKYYLNQKAGIDVNSPKTALKAFFNENKLSYDDYEVLIQMIDDRNYLSHIYKEEMMVRVLVKLPGYLKVIANVYNSLKE